MAVTWEKIPFDTEVAGLSDAIPESVSTASSAGISGAASRSDHVHDIAVGAINAANLIGAGVVDAAALAPNAVVTSKILDLNVTTAKLAADAVDGTKIADDAIGSEHIEPLSAPLDFNGQQAEDFVVENSALAPVTAVLGKLYYDTDDNHVYVCTSII